MSAEGNLTGSYHAGVTARVVTWSVVLVAVTTGKGAAIISVGIVKGGIG